MTAIAITDDVAAHLDQAAAQRGCSRDDLARVYIDDGLRRLDGELDLSPETRARVLESVAQAARGDVIPGEAVVARLSAALAAIEAR